MDVNSEESVARLESLLKWVCYFKTLSEYLGHNEY